MEEYDQYTVKKGTSNWNMSDKGGWYVIDNDTGMCLICPYDTWDEAVEICDVLQNSKNADDWNWVEIEEGQFDEVK